MCTYQNKTKLKCSKVVAGISVLLGIMGIVCLAIGAMAQGRGFPDVIQKIMQPNGEAQQSRPGIGTPIIALGVLVLFVSLLGCATMKFKNAFVAIPFGFLTFIFGVCLLIVGIIAYGQQFVFDMIKTTICNGNAKNPTTVFDLQYNEMVVKPMCSEVCPCDIDTFAKFKASTTDETARKHGRTFKLKSGSETNNARSQGISASMVLLIDNTKSKGTGYKNFYECYDKVLSKQVPNKKNGGAKMKEWFKQLGLGDSSKGILALKGVEDNYECAGVCQAPLFYVEQPAYKTPTKACIKQIALKMGTQLKPAGIICIITSLISFIAFCGSIPLCKGFNDEEEEDK